MSDEKQPPAPLEATAMVEACAKVLYDISDHARDFEALARRVLADRKAAVEAAVDESFARGVERTKIAEAADRAERDTYWGERFDLERAERIAKVEAAVEKAENDWACACRMDCERERAERLRAVEEAAYDAHEYLPDDMYSAHRAISAIVAAAKGEKP